MSICPINPLSETEQAEVQKILTDPVVVKYFTQLQNNVANDILTASPLHNEEDKFYMRRLEYFRGQLSVFQTLLSIKKVQ